MPMIPFGFIPTAAPQMAPLTDTPLVPGAFEETGAAFDAALAATLAVIETESGSTAAPQDAAAFPEWLFPATLTLPVEQPAVVMPVLEASAGVGNGLDIDDDLAAPDATPEDDSDLGAAPGIAPPVIAPPVMILPEVTASAQPVAASASPAATEAKAVVAAAPVPIMALPPQVDQDVAPVPPKAERVAALQAASARTLPTSPATALATSPKMEAGASTQTAPAVAADPPPAPVAAAAGTAAPFVPAMEMPREMPAGERPGVAVMPRVSQPAPAATAAVSTPMNEAAAPTELAAVAAPLTPQLTTPAPVGGTVRDGGETSEPGVRLAIGSDTASGQQPAMTGEEQFSQGGSRQSPEFARFAAALSQVVPADDGSRAAGQAFAAAVTVAPAPAPATGAAAVAPVAPAAPAAPADTPEAENVGRLVQAMRVMARPGAWEATVRLKPEHFGDVTIALKVERNAVSAVVNAEAAGVRQWLESQEQAVRSGMAEHGLQLERFVVQRDGQRRDAQPQEQAPTRRQPRRQPETSERFEIVV